MRDIEFRAWHPDNEELVYFDAEKASSDEYIARHFFELMAGTHEIGVGLEQYTGLKDKNGVKIFEGDIVLWGHVEGWEELSGARHAVVSLDPALQFNCFKPMSHVFEWGSFMYTNTEQAMEVIGNIHENPELINGGKK